VTRERLPQRRHNETLTLKHEHVRYSMTVGFFADRRPGEVFASGARIGSAMDAILDDASILISLLLQHGVAPKDIAKSLGRLGAEQGPASIIGAILALLGERTECLAAQ
jgi:hypothetical protein